MSSRKKASTKHVHAIPEIDHWGRPQNLNAGGKALHACYFCRPSLYDPMPENCTPCARCGVFMWTGEDDPMNAAMLVCGGCESELASEHEAS